MCPLFADRRDLVVRASWMGSASPGSSGGGGRYVPPRDLTQVRVPSDSTDPRNPVRMASSLVVRLGPALEPLGEPVERWSEIWHRAPDQPDQRSGVLLAYPERRSPGAVWRYLEGPYAPEQAQWHAATEPQPGWRIKVRHPDGEGPAGRRLGPDRDLLTGRDLAVDSVDT